MNGRKDLKKDLGHDIEIKEPIRHDFLKIPDRGTQGTEHKNIVTSMRAIYSGKVVELSQMFLATMFRFFQGRGLEVLINMELAVMLD